MNYAIHTDVKHKPLARLVPALVLLALAAPASAQSPCGPNGLTLGWGGTTRLGDAFSIDLLGTPSVNGLLGVDVLPGPVATPVGLVCLGLSPSFQSIPFSLSPQGTFSIGGILPTDPSFYGVGAYLQAAAVDTTQPNGYALSNGIHPVLRPPRLWVLQGPGSPGALCIYDTIADTASPAIPLPSSVIQAAALPSLGWLAVLVAATTGGPGPRLMLIDETGATQLDHPLAGGAVSPVNMVVDGTTAYVLFSGPASGFVQSISLPTGLPGNTAPLAFSPQTSLLAYPGTGVVFVRSGLDVVPVNVANGVALGPISLGAAPGSSNSIADWLFKDGILYCLLSGSGLFGIQTPFQLNAIDATTLTALHPATVLLPVANGASRLSWAVGPAGPALFTVNVSSLFQISPATLQVTVVVPTGVVLNGSGHPTAGGSALALYGSMGFSGFFQLVDLSTFALSPTFPVPSFPQSGAVLPVPSTTLRKLYAIHPSGTGVQVSRYGTDPLTPLQGATTLPLSASSVIAIVD